MKLETEVDSQPVIHADSDYTVIWDAVASLVWPAEMPEQIMLESKNINKPVRAYHYLLAVAGDQDNKENVKMNDKQSAEKERMQDMAELVHMWGPDDTAEYIIRQQTAMRAALEKLETARRLLRDVETPNYSTDLAGGRNCVVNAMDDLHAALPDETDD